MSDSLIHVIHQLGAIIIFNTYYLPLLWFRMIILEETRFLSHPAKERAPQLGEEREDEQCAVYTFQPTIADTNLGNCVFVDLLIILFLYLMRGAVYTFDTTLGVPPCQILREFPTQQK